MEEKKKALTELVKSAIALMFYNFDCSETQFMIDLLCDEAVNDVIETSDYPEYNSSDVIIAVKRVLLKKLGMEL